MNHNHEPFKKSNKFENLFSLSFLLLIFFSIGQIRAQKVFNVETPAEGSIELAAGININKVNSGYTLWLPETDSVKGLVLFTHARRDTVNDDLLIREAFKEQLAVMYATTDNRLEFFFSIKRLKEIENYLQTVVENHRIPKENILFCGMSLEGTRALKLAIFAASENSEFHLRPRAIAICDAPLDFVRFYQEMVKAKDLKFSPVAENEGTWVSEYLRKNLQGSPKEAFQNYVYYSPFCYSANGGDHLGKFKNIAIRAYTEPDVNWWIDNRRKDYYGMNAIDLAAFINMLKINGNKEAELILTNNKGYDDLGNRHPHNWNIVDEKELIQWFSRLIN
jgi:hypothetical protein